MEFLVFSENTALVKQALDRLAELPPFKFTFKEGGNFISIGLQQGDPYVFEEMLQRKLISTIGAGNYFIRRLA